MNRLRKHFPRQLQIIKSQRYGTIGKLAKKIKIAEGTLSRFMVGHNKPDVRNLKALCHALPDEEAAAVLQAHLQDEIPEGCEHLVRVVANPDGKPSDQTLEQLKLSDHAKLTLESIANLFAERPSSITAFKQLAHYLRTDKFLPSCPYEANPQKSISLPPTLLWFFIGGFVTEMLPVALEFL